jgi:hypothetical protein
MPSLDSFGAPLRPQGYISGHPNLNPNGQGRPPNRVLEFGRVWANSLGATGRPKLGVYRRSAPMAIDSSSGDLRATSNR